MGLFAQDIVEWRGIDRTGIYPDTGLLKEWPANGPELILELEGIGGGYSSPVVYENVIYVTGIRDSIDIISAFNMSGKQLWQKDYGKAWYRSYPDNRNTPTIENGKIYLISGMGEVVCLKAKDGSEIWRINAHVNYQGAYHKWGVAESVLLTENAAIYTTGGNQTTVVALDKQTGAEIWKSESLGGARAYATPSLIERNGLKIILAQTTNDLIGINAANGKVLWSFDLIQYHVNRMGKGAQTNTPLYHNGEIFVTSGYDHPGIMFTLSDDGKSLSEKWKNYDLDCHFGGVVMLNSKIYGSNWSSNRGGNWVCLDWDTGKTEYEHTWTNKGAIIAADNMLYCYEEKSGNVGLVKPDPERFELVGSFKMENGSGPHWAHPAIFNGKLFIRHGDVLAIYNIKAN